MPSVERLTTFQIGSIYGVPARSLRFYEEQGLLSPLIMDGVRYFTAKDRIRLELIIKGKRLGFSFIELKLLITNAAEQNAAGGEVRSFAEPVGQWLGKDELVEEIWQIERKIEELQKTLSDLQSRLNRS